VLLIAAGQLTAAVTAPVAAPPGAVIVAVGR
jgi:hypothetical protein